MKWTAFKAYNWTDFCATVAQREHVSGWNYSSTLPGREDFTQVSGPAENLDLMRKGWPEGARRIIDGVTALSAAQDDMSPQWAMDVCGAFPDVGAYLAGEVEHMHNPDIDAPSAPVLRLFVAGGYSAMTEAWQIENYGIALLTLIDSLERDGRQIELVIGYTMQPTKPSRKGSTKRVASGEPPCCVQITLKQAGEQMDLDRMAYALAHPAMLRVSVFAAIEQHYSFAPLGPRYGFPWEFPNFAKEEGTVYFPRLCPAMYNLNSPASALESLRGLVEL